MANSQKLSFTNTRSLCSNSPNVLAPFETNLDDSIDSGIFSVSGYLLLIRNDSSTHMHGLSVYVKDALPFPKDLSLGHSADSYLCFCLALLHSVSYFFFLYDHFLYLYVRFLMLLHLRYMGFSISTHLLLCLSLESLMSIIRTG